MQEETAEKILTGIMCGSFNPLHMGHIMIANYMYAFENLEEVWLIVTPRCPSDKGDDMADATVRSGILSRFCNPYPRISPCDIEFRLSPPYYTINTIIALKEQYPEREFVLLLGEDNWANFHYWYRSEDIRNEVSILVYPRKDSKTGSDLPENVRKVNAPLIEISSTFIRNAIKEDRDIRSFLPVGEYEYLIENKIYNK
ncbi:nicotinate (nicotinamide) nucleotide adenylyltransferase [Dysgonomonas termitidis]|uniref:Probable nicotinate-nucleotide adenylyltransferase n=1 Tax=Dysgonomonas termitidis TaxID=1516126 RepID=A0ABV9L3P7_9BACT